MGFEWREFVVVGVGSQLAPGRIVAASYSLK
jgi:hypothetical protein